MKLLFLTPQLPYPPHQGTSLRNFNIIRGLAERHQISLLSFREGGEEPDWQNLQPLVDLCEQIHTIPEPNRRSTSRRFLQMVSTTEPDLALRLQNSRFEITLRRILSENMYDIVQVEGIEMAWTINVIRAVRMDQKIVFDAHNAESKLQKRAGEADRQTVKRWPAAGYSWIQHQRLSAYEMWACSEADWVTAVSQTDKEILQEQVGSDAGNISVIPNSIDVEAYENARENAATANNKTYDIVFTGKMDYRPNVDAVLWFAEEVWPGIIAQRPASSWAIVGQKPHDRLAAIDGLPGLTITGWVADVLPYLLGGKVFIMPFRVGSGTRLKLIEALAVGVPVVSTSLGVEGYPITDGQELLMADTADEMSAAVLRLLNEPELGWKMGENGRLFARNYDWRRVTPKFDEVYHALVA